MCREFEIKIVELKPHAIANICPGIGCRLILSKRVIKTPAVTMRSVKIIGGKNQAKEKYFYAGDENVIWNVAFFTGSREYCIDGANNTK